MNRYIARVGVLIIFLCSISVKICYGYDGDSGAALIDMTREGKVLANYVKITPESFEKAAILALMSHKWSITNISNDEVDGEQVADGYTVKILRKNRGRDEKTVVQIYINGPSDRQNWADNIRHEMIYTLVLLSK